jgi:hypothetical protein
MEQRNQRLPWSGAPDCLVCHRTVSGAPPDSVRCTREFHSELATFGKLGGRSAIIHRTVRCSIGLSSAPSGATAPSANGRLQRYRNSEQCSLYAQKSEQASEGAPDSEQWLSGAPPDCSVAHLSEAPTVRTQRQGDVAAHRTVSGGAPDCPVGHATAGFTNDYFGGWGYKYPQPPTIHCIQVFSLQTSYKSYNIQYKTQTKRSNPLPSPKSLQTN